MINPAKSSQLNRSEREQNRLLRRADWRFLLPDPLPGKSVCYGEGLFRRSLAEISDRLVRPQEALPAECDLVAAANPDPGTIQAAWKLLRPGGMLYAEWRSLSAILQVGGKTGARQLVEAAGFNEARMYWAWPPPERSSPSFWLPVEAPEAVDFFLRNRPRPASLVERIKRRLLVPAWRVGLRSQFLAPLSLIASKPQPSGVDRETVSRLLLTGGSHSTNKVVTLVFANRESEPRRAMKYPRTAESIPGILREKEILQAIHAAGLGSGACLPQVVDYKEQGGLPVLVETPVVGQPLYTYIRKNSYRSLALKVTEWLPSLVFDRRPLARSDWWDRIVLPALADFERSFRPALSDGDLAKTVTALETLEGLPTACEQRDCSPWNLLIAPGGELAVVDWESAELEGLAGLDLVYFLAYMAFFCDGAMESGNFLQSYRRAKDPGTFTGRVQAECERNYLQATGLSPTVLHPLRLLAWLIHSRSEYRRMAAGAGALPGVERLRSSLFFRLWRAELEEAADLPLRKQQESG